MKIRTDNALMRMPKRELIEELRCAEHNQTAAEELLAQHIENVKDWVPVTHGKWNIMSGTKSRRVCSRCGWDVPEYGKFYSYCPNCGAKMDGGDDDAAD